MLHPPAPPDFRTAKLNTPVSIAIRVTFFLACAIVGADVIESAAAVLLHSVFLAAVLSVFSTALLANLLTMRIFDRRPLADIGLGGKPGSGRNFLTGLVLAATTATVMLVIPLLAGRARIVARPTASFAWLSVIFYLILLLFSATGEEALFHGYAFQLLVEKIGPFATILPVGCLFGLAHTSNPNASRLGLLNTALWGILLGYAFLRSRDLWLPIGMHFGWNAVLPLFGASLSGITIEVTRYSYRWDLSTLWSGGAYGPEGGLLATCFICLLFFALAKTPVVPQLAAIARSLNEPQLKASQSL